MKLLVNTPEGVQDIIVVGEGGGYFDLSLVLWDERLDGPLPDDTIIGGMIREENSLVYSEERMRATIDILNKPSVPQNVSPRQIRQAMNRVPFGETTLREAVEAVISGGTQDIKDWYEFATEFYRQHEDVALLAEALNVSESDLDNLWILAASL